MKNKILIDDGFNPELVETAMFDGILEMPCIKAPSELIIPTALIPFSQLSRSQNRSEFIDFYEYDIQFGGILKHPEKYIDVFHQFPGMISPDNSVYFDSPLLVQMANVYRSRAIGHYYQENGIYVIPNVRWGDERSYSTCVFPEKFAFLGVPKQSIVSIGTYGACKSREEKYHFRQGLIAMLEELEPKVVLVYGAMPSSIFGDLQNETQFIHYPDWITLKKRGDI